MKISIYELLGLIKYGKAPKKIKMFSKVYEYDEESIDYINDKGAISNYLKNLGFGHLTDEVEILDEPKEDKIEKLSILTFSDLIDMEKEGLVNVIKEQRFKINELIDEANKLKVNNEPR